MRLTKEALTVEALKAGIPADLKKAKDVVWATLCAALGALKHRAPEVAAGLVTEALELTSAEPTPNVLAVWEAHEDLLNWELL